jgi:hypothetical protein
LTLAVMGYALFAEFAKEAGAPDDEVEVGAALDPQKRRSCRCVRTRALPARCSSNLPAVTPRSCTPRSASSSRPLHRSSDQLVVGVPASSVLGVIKLRVVQGERRSKPWPLRVAPLPHGARASARS